MKSKFILVYTLATQSLLIDKSYVRKHDEPKEGGSHKAFIDTLKDVRETLREGVTAQTASVRNVGPETALEPPQPTNVYGILAVEKPARVTRNIRYGSDEQ
jgi:hypothetical protein